MSIAYQLRRIRFSHGEKQILFIDKWVIEKNQIIALSGCNGVGKSTLFNLLAFISRPESGEIYFMDEKVTPQDFVRHRHRVGLVQQNPYLLRGSVFDNLEIGLKFQRMKKSLRQQRVNEVIERLSMMDLKMRASHLLSGGEAQKVAIGRILVLCPEVILLDEPFTYLDQRVSVAFSELINQLCREDKKTIIFSTHDFNHTKLQIDQHYILENDGSICHLNTDDN